ncbi:hypothetical protein ASNO1_77530 [Corallococcus caeni]|uniref:Uncharacterized protein n=1 Tax=Corallococcus caeni TaxID=3082388 RepID=A0ABQ6R5C0_9BACT|nr:hypothetical protein ASNO1_77530 [Corallococcus sp. NO1]
MAPASVGDRPLESAFIKACRVGPSGSAESCCSIFRCAGAFAPAATGAAMDDAALVRREGATVAVEGAGGTGVSTLGTDVGVGPGEPEILTMRAAA